MQLFIFPPVSSFDLSYSIQQRNGLSIESHEVKNGTLTRNNQRGSSYFHEVCEVLLLSVPGYIMPRGCGILEAVSPPTLRSLVAESSRHYVTS